MFITGTHNKLNKDFALVLLDIRDKYFLNKFFHNVLFIVQEFYCI